MNTTVKHTELAQKILSFMGKAVSPSLEPGSDRTTDRLAEKLAEWESGVPRPEPISPNWYNDPADPDRWFECPDDCDIISSLADEPFVGMEFELDVCWNGTQRFRFTKIEDETSDDVEVELIGGDSLYAAPVSADVNMRLLETLRRIALNISGDTPAHVIAGEALAESQRLLLEAAGKEQDRQISERVSAVAVVDESDDGYFAEILPDQDVKRGQLLYAGPQVPEWQPIETAPKDGTAILAKIPDSDVPYSVRWGGMGNCWIMVWDHAPLTGLDTPTHWMPLPAAPGVKP